MRTVAYWCFALLLAGAVPALAAPGDPVKAEPVAGQQAAAPQAAPPPGAAPPGAPRTAGERRRTRSYARCNRAAINRGLRGGARRRFLIRCRLGYERGIGQPGQTAPAAAPMRKP